MNHHSVISYEIPVERDQRYRWFERLPAIISWSLLLLPPLLAYWFPWAVSSALLIYTLFWFFRSVRMTGRLLIGYHQYRRAITVDWLRQCQDLPAELGWSKLTHVAIVAISNESEPIVAATLAALAASSYPLRRVVVVLAVEARGGEAVQTVAAQVTRRFRRTFRACLTVTHPSDQPGEVRGKGANISYAARTVRAWIDTHRIAYEQVLVTTLDADNRVHPKYLAYLSAAYLTDQDRLHTSYQPIPMFFNNIWDVPLPIRSIAIGSSFWQLMESTRPQRLRNFSAHAQSFAALVATNYWSVKTIVEDGHQYWRTFFRFHGKHRVVPLYVPIYQDAVLSPQGYLASFREQYLQKRRWAWGVSDVPFVFTRLLDSPSLGFAGWLQAFRLLEGHISWATTSLMLAVVGWSPLLINPIFRSSILAVNYPFIYTRILQLSLAGLIVSLTISLLTLPPFPKGRRLGFSLFLEYLTAPILLPISNVLFGSLPALEAQTRLFLGQYLEFRVTEKAAARHEHADLIQKH